MGAPAVLLQQAKGYVRTTRRVVTSVEGLQGSQLAQAILDFQQEYPGSRPSITYSTRKRFYSGSYDEYEESYPVLSAEVELTSEELLVELEKVINVLVEKGRLEEIEVKNASSRLKRTHETIETLVKIQNFAKVQKNLGL